MLSLFLEFYTKVAETYVVGERIASELIRESRSRDGVPKCLINASGASVVLP